MDKLKDSDQSIEQQIWGTDKPYYHVGQPGFLQKYRFMFYRAIGPINPFAKKQVPKKDEITYRPFNGRWFYNTPALPNPFGFNQIYPSHMNPVLEENMELDVGPAKANSKAHESSLEFQEEFLPLACERSIQRYKKCLLVNGEEKCTSDGEELVQICPNFALDLLRKRKLKKHIAKHI